MKRIDYEYYGWLIGQVHIPNRKSYNDVFELMHNMEFVWTVPNDDNRVQDGLDLRQEFSNRHHQELLLQGVTMLEILISLSRRLAFTASGDATVWAWKLLKNLKLTKKVDPLTSIGRKRVIEILEAVVWRTYQPDGQGGFFPLKAPKEDQTHVEIWYQMNAYVIEMKGY
jgi:hypothetical protein